MRNSILEIKKEIQLKRTYAEVEKYLKSIDDIQVVDYSFYNKEEKYMISLTSNEIYNFEKYEHITIEQVNPNANGLSFNLIKANRFIPYIVDIAIMYKIKADKIDTNFINKFKNPFVQDSELLDSHNIDVIQMCKFFSITDKQLHLLLLEEIKKELETHF